MATDNTTSTKPTISIDDMASINPLIDSDGSTYAVGSALEAIASLLDQGQGVKLDEAQAFGVTMMLRTCAAALRQMSEVAA